MKKGKEIKISYWAAHATTIVSVTLVLLTIGLIALISFAARQETRRMKESLQISVILADSISNESAAATAARIKTLPFCRNMQLITKEMALEEWKADTGEDLEALFGVNPLSPEISFNMPERYSAPDSITMIERRLAAFPGVESVATPQGEMVASMNNNITRLSAILGGIAAVMLVISFVLINNTVHLTVYARRFLIHTMQLVGATNSFIRRPFVVRNLCAGLLAGTFASLLLSGAVAAAPRLGFIEIGNYISWPLLAATDAALILLGGAICSIAASLATTHYLRKDYGKLVTA